MSVKGIVALGIAGLVALIALFTVTGSFYSVDETERAVILRNGAFQSVASPGFHTKTPFIDEVITFDVTQQGWSDNNISVYSQDQQQATLKMSVIYRVNVAQVEEVFRQFKTIENAAEIAIKPRAFRSLKEVFGQYNAARSVGERAKLGQDVEEHLRERLAGQPFEIVAVQVEDIDYGDEYDHNIKARMKAEVAVAEQKQVLNKEKVDAEIKVVQANASAEATMAAAKASADATLLQAQADAKGIELRGLAEAEAIQKRADAIAKNPSIVAFTQAQRWDGKLPVTMIPGGTLPFLDVNKVIGSAQ